MTFTRCDTQGTRLSFSIVATGERGELDAGKCVDGVQDTEGVLAFYLVFTQ